MTQSVDAVKTEQRDDVLALAGVGALALLLGLVVAWLLAGSLAKPLRGLAGVARRSYARRPRRPRHVEGSTEQQEVATAFNDMTARTGTRSRPARLRRERLAPTAHAAHGSAPPSRGRGAEEPRPRGRARAHRRRARDRAACPAPLELLTLAGGPTASGPPLDVSELVQAHRRPLEGQAELGSRASSSPPSAPPAVIAASARTSPRSSTT